MPASEAGTRYGVSAVTARKWLGRYLSEGAAGLLDKSSRPACSPRAITPSVALAIVELRRKLFLQARIASYMGVSKATVSRVLRRAGLSRLSALQPAEPVQEPVGEVVIGESGFTKGWTVVQWREDLPPIATGTKLYTAPQATQPLTDEQIAALVLQTVYEGDASTPHRDAWATEIGIPFARAIERYLKGVSENG